MIIELRDDQNTVVDTDKVSMIRGYTEYNWHTLTYSFQVAIGFDIMTCCYPTQDNSDQGKFNMYKVFKEDYDKVKGALLAKQELKQAKKDAKEYLTDGWNNLDTLQWDKWSSSTVINPETGREYKIFTNERTREVTKEVGWDWPSKKG